MALPRATTCRILAISAALCLLLANLGIWAHDVVYDRLGFRATARAIFDEPRVQEEIASRVVTALVGEGEDRAPIAEALQTRLQDRLARALGGPVLAPIVDRVLDFSWRVMVEREPKAVVLEATQLRAIGLSIAEERNPELAERIRALPTPLRIELLKADAVPSMAPYRGPVEGLVWLFSGLAVLLGVLSIRLAPDAAHALRRMGLLTGIPAAILGLIALLLPAVVAEGLFVQIAVRVVLMRLLAQCVLLIAVGFALYWVGRAGGWLRNVDKRLERIEASVSGTSPGSQ